MWLFVLSFAKQEIRLHKVTLHTCFSAVAAARLGSTGSQGIICPLSFFLSFTMNHFIYYNLCAEGVNYWLHQRGRGSLSTRCQKAAHPLNYTVGCQRRSFGFLSQGAQLVPVIITRGQQTPPHPLLSRHTAVKLGICRVLPHKGVTQTPPCSAQR